LEDKLWENVAVVVLTMRVQILQRVQAVMRGCRCGKMKKMDWERVFSLWTMSQYEIENMMVFTKMYLGRAIAWEISPFDSQLVEGCGTDWMV
jgi:hypothetical protein